MTDDNTGTTTAALGQTALVGYYRVQPQQVIEDSRCPINALLCIGTGLGPRIVVSTYIATLKYRKVANLELGRPKQVPGGILTLIEANPAPVAGQDMGYPASYRFTFRFDPET